MMLGFLAKKPVLFGLAGIVLVTIVGLGYHHYTSLLDRVEALQAQSATLTLGLDIERQAVVDLQDVIKEWERSQEDLTEKIKEMQDESNEARAETRRLRQLFAELDFDDLAPAALDSIADGTTDRLWRLIDDASDPGRYGGGGPAPGEAGASGPGADRVGEGGLDGGADPGRSGPRPHGGAVSEPGNEPR